VSTRAKNWLPKTSLVCLFLCSLCTASFERIWTKFGMWHTYNLWMVMGRLASVARARSLFTPLQMGSDWRAPSGNSQLAGGRQAQWTEHRTEGARVTEREGTGTSCRREGTSPCTIIKLTNRFASAEGLVKISLLTLVEATQTCFFPCVHPPTSCKLATISQ